MRILVSGDLLRPDIEDLGASWRCLAPHDGRVSLFSDASLPFAAQGTGPHSIDDSLHMA